LVPNSLVGTEIAVAGTEVPLATVARRGDSIVVSCSIVPGAAMWKVAAVFFYQRSHLKFTALQYGTKQKKKRPNKKHEAKFGCLARKKLHLSATI
jgi:hypothetical protein